MGIAPGHFHQDFGAISAAPGFAFGKAGNVNNAFLKALDVPSDTTGFPIRLTGGLLTFIAASNSNDTATFDVEIYEHDGTTYTLLTTLNIVTSRGGDFTPTPAISITYGLELAAKIVNAGTGVNSCKDPNVIAFSTGDLP